MHKEKLPRAALAIIEGGPLAPQISGKVFFYDAPQGTWVYAMVDGLPKYRPGRGNLSPVGPHGFHIHEFGACAVGDPHNPFQAAGGHWNPDNQPHGQSCRRFPGAVFQRRNCPAVTSSPTASGSGKSLAEPLSSTKTPMTTAPSLPGIPGGDWPAA